MKYLIITGIFALGISLGYVVGTQQTPDESTTVAINPVNQEKPEIVEDDSENDREKPAAETTLDSLEAMLDTTDLVDEDSLMMVEYTMIDSMNDEDLSISREKLIRGVRLPVIYLTQPEVKDSALKESLGIEEVQAKTIFVEFWESPLNFEGYKLSKKKLIVYGMSPQFDYKLYKRDSEYYFAFQNVYYKMKETQDFLPFSEVAKSEEFNDWIL